MHFINLFKEATFDQEEEIYKKGGVIFEEEYKMTLKFFNLEFEPLK